LTITSKPSEISKETPDKYNPAQLHGYERPNPNQTRSFRDKFSANSRYFLTLEARSVVERKAEKIFIKELIQPV
jgi:hypothetical protein